MRMTGKNGSGERKILTILLVQLFVCIAMASAQWNTDSAKAILNKENLSPARRVATLNALAAWYNKDSTNSALVYANEAYLIALKENDRPGQVQSLLNLAEGYLYNDAYDQSLQYAYQALDLSQDLKDSGYLAQCYTSLGWIFYDTENPGLSLQYHTAAQQLYKRRKEDKRNAISLNAIGLVYQMKSEYDSARAFFEKALDIANQFHWPGTTSAAYNNIAICANAAGQYTTALSFFDKALQLQSLLNAPLSMAETLTQSAYSRFMLKQYREAQDLLNRSRQFIDQSTSNEKKEKLLDNLHIASSLYEAQGNYPKAFEALQAYTRIRNELITRAKSEAIASIPLKRETLQKEKEMRALAAQKELRSFQRNILALLIVLLVIIGALWYSRLRQKQRKEKELEAMKQTLMQQELEKSVLEKEGLNNKLTFKNTELKNYAFFIAQRNELMKEFTEKLADLKLEGQLKTESLSKWKALIQRFNQELDNNTEARDLNLSIEENHRDFFYNLLQRYPKLTEYERRLCAQIRLNLSIKDIASLNNISIKSAEMARYRLRKHFGLQHNENLNDFLQQF